MIHEIYYFEGVVTVMSLSDAVNGFSGEIAWNCADRSLFGACQLETGDQVQVVSSYFGNVIIKAKGKRLAITSLSVDLFGGLEHFKNRLLAKVINGSFFYFYF